MKVSESIDVWWKGFKKSSFSSKNKEDMKDDSDLSLQTSFISFLRHQANQILEHQKYEKDITHSVASHSEVLVEFKVEDYVNNIDTYFEKKGLYKEKVEELLSFILNILVPPEDIRDILAKDIRISLFAGMLIKIGLHVRVSLADIIKIYYNKISALIEPINGVEADTILELYKESIDRTNKLQDSKKRQNSDLEENPFSVHEVLDEILRGFSIRKGRDLKRLYGSAYFLDDVFGFVFNTALIVLYLYFHREIHDFFGRVTGNSGSYAYDLIIFGILVTVFSFGIVNNISRRGKRRALKRTLKTVIEHFNISHAFLKRYFSNKYGFDVKRIR